MSSVIRIPHNRLTHGEAEFDAVGAVVRSGYWAQGPEVLRFESAIAAAAGRRCAVGVGSGIAALRLALLAVGTRPGDEVVIPAYSCVALANAVLACGAVPVLTDIREADWNIDPGAAASACSSRTRAIIAVHTFGAPAPIVELRRNGIAVIEDCAHGLVTGRMGALADIAITSLYATKLIGAGAGGAILADDPELTVRMKHWRDYEDQPADGTRLNDKMTDLAAALAGCQLERLGSMVARRDAIARRYLATLRPLAERGLVRLPADQAPRVWYRFAIESLASDADILVERMRRRGIGADKPVFDWRAPGRPDYPVADRAYRVLVSLPIYPTLENSEQDRVIEALFDAYSESD